MSEMKFIARPSLDRSTGTGAMVPTNVSFTFDNRVTLSIGASSFHYCSPRKDYTSHEIGWSFVEIALFDGSGDWITREVVDECVDDDVCSVSVERLPAIMIQAKKWYKR